jgi:hypothetical protein
VISPLCSEDNPILSLTRSTFFSLLFVQHIFVVLFLHRVNELVPFIHL